jgi:hypothetical protein
MVQGLSVEEEHIETTRTLPNVAHLSRFAMATGTVVWAYLLAGGIPAKEWTSSLIPLKITHPEFLVAMFLVVALHASWRYWYYGVHLPLTRTKIRQYLQTPESVLVFSAVAPVQIPVIRNRTQEDDLRCMLGERLLPGMDEKDFLFFSDTDPGETQADMVRFLLARKLQKYFPGLQPHNILPRNALSDKPNYIHWGHVSSLDLGTRWRAWLEDFDLCAPVLLNIVGMLALGASWIFCWPSVRCVLGG